METDNNTQSNPFSMKGNDTSPWNMDPTNDIQNNNKAETAIRLIDSYGVDTIIYTDGSCAEGTMNGGCAAMITTGSARNPVTLEELKKKGAKYTCSYDEERAAMYLALEWIRDNNASTDTIICSDSQSLLTAIANNSRDTEDIRKLLDSFKGKTVLQWVPSHVNIPGNEMADRAAKGIAEMNFEPNDTAVSYNAAKALIKRRVNDPAIQHVVAAKSYEHLSINKEKKIIKTRKQAATLAQLRSGHCLKLAHYRHRLDETKTDLCPNCEEQAQTVEHWIKCPALRQQRMDSFEKDSVGLGILSSNPTGVLTYASATL